MPMPQSHTRSKRSREMAIAFVFVTMLLLLNKTDIIKRPTGQICLLRGNFSFQNKAHFRFSMKHRMSK